MTLTTNSMFNFTRPITNGCNIKNINEFAATKAACSLVLSLPFFSMCVRDRTNKQTNKTTK